LLKTQSKRTRKKKRKKKWFVFASFHETTTVELTLANALICCKSEEDLKKKQELDLLVERVQDKDAGVQKLALEALRQEIKSSTSSMTSVPKPLKFLRPHYSTLKTFFSTVSEGETKVGNNSKAN